MRNTHTEVDLRLEVARRRAEADDVIVLELRDPRGVQLPAWTPGAHIALGLPGGMVRQYSLCGDPADRCTWRIAVLGEHAGRGGSAYVHGELHPAAQVDVRGPRNHFPLVTAPRYLLIAGGIGITPILPMVATVAGSGAEWELHYGGRNRRSMAFLDLIEATPGERVITYPLDEVGLIDLDRIVAAPRPDTLVYCCGPESLLTAVEQRCASWPSGALHVERFAPKQQDEPRFTGPFEVELAASGVTLTVPPEKSVLQVVEEAGIAVLSSCQEGTCGTCETAILGGEVDHRDSLLTPEEQAAGDTMFICVSRAASPRLVLDL
jgi:ferredoxin-NADP reductase